MAILKCIPRPESYWGKVNPIGIRSCYDEGKRCAETLFFDYWRQHKLRIKVVRIFNTYGPRMHPNDGRVVSNFIMQALRNEDITIYGDGKQTRSFCYVDDMIAAFQTMMDSGDDFTGPVNVGNPVENTMIELAEQIIKLTKSSSRLVFKPLPADDPKQRQPNIDLAKEKLGWEPKVALTEGWNALSPISRSWFERSVNFQRLGITCSWLNSSSAILRPARPIAARFSGDVSNSDRADAKAAALRAGTSRPLTPSMTVSRHPTTSVVTIGLPQASASSNDRGNPSR